jgi:hypothetical protein
MGRSALPENPTAHALRAEVTATPLSQPWRAPAGLGATFHADPFHRAIKVADPEVPIRPTAHALRAEKAAT